MHRTFRPHAFTVLSVSDSGTPVIVFNRVHDWLYQFDLTWDSKIHKDSKLEGPTGKPRTLPRPIPSNPTCPIAKAITPRTRTKMTNSHPWLRWSKIVPHLNQIPRPQLLMIMPGARSAGCLARTEVRSRRTRNKQVYDPSPTVLPRQDHQTRAPMVTFAIARNPPSTPVMTR
jgi:hypothetical protein